MKSLPDSPNPVYLTKSDCLEKKTIAYFDPKKTFKNESVIGSYTNTLQTIDFCEEERIITSNEAEIYRTALIEKLNELREIELIITKDDGKRITVYSPYRPGSYQIAQYQVSESRKNGMISETEEIIAQVGLRKLRNQYLDKKEKNAPKEKRERHEQ